MQAARDGHCDQLAFGRWQWALAIAICRTLCHNLGLPLPG